MSYLELSQDEVNDIVNFINQRAEELENIERNLNNLTRNFRALTVEELESKPFDIKASIMDAKASLLSNVTNVLSSVSGLFQKIKSVPSKILNALLAFLKIFWKIISKYISIFKIESIKITISATPSVEVDIKP
jgi:hypothetical protein